MWLLFVPILVLAVVAFMLVATLFAGVFWVVGAGWPWLLIGLGAWLFWHEDGRHYRRRGWRHRTQTVAQSQSQARKKADEPPPPSGPAAALQPTPRGRRVGPGSALAPGRVHKERLFGDGGAAPRPVGPRAGVVPEASVREARRDQLANVGPVVRDQVGGVGV